MQAEGQTLGSASNYSAQLAASDFQADGILGMGFQALAQLDGTPVFETMMKQGQTDSGVFAVRLAASDEGPSELYLGDVDPQFYEGEFTYTDVSEPVSFSLVSFTPTLTWLVTGLLASYSFGYPSPWSLSRSQCTRNRRYRYNLDPRGP